MNKETSVVVQVPLKDDPFLFPLPLLQLLVLLLRHRQKYKSHRSRGPRLKNTIRSPIPRRLLETRRHSSSALSPRECLQKASESAWPCGTAARALPEGGREGGRDKTGKMRRRRRRRRKTSSPIQRDRACQNIAWRCALAVWALETASIVPAGRPRRSADHLHPYHTKKILCLAWSLCSADSKNSFLQK